MNIPGDFRVSAVCPVFPSIIILQRIIIDPTYNKRRMHVNYSKNLTFHFLCCEISTEENPPGIHRGDFSPNFTKPCTLLRSEKLIVTLILIIICLLKIAGGSCNNHFVTACGTLITESEGYSWLLAVEIAIFRIFRISRIRNRCFKYLTMRQPVVSILHSFILAD